MNPTTEELLVQEIVPRIRNAVANSMRQVGADDIDELVADGIATAVSLLASTEARGKKVTPGNVAFYAVGLVRQGRRSYGASATDVMHPGTQINGRSSLVSLDAPLASEGDGEETMCLHETLACSGDDPSVAAGRRLDWAPVVALLEANALEVLACLAIGEDLTTLVPKLNRSRSALQTDKEKLAQLLTEQFGADILVQVQQRPRWRDNVEATREKMACRFERQPA